MWIGDILGSDLSFQQIMTEIGYYALRRGIGRRERKKWMIITHFKAPKTETAVVAEMADAYPG